MHRPAEDDDLITVIVEPRPQRPQAHEPESEDAHEPEGDEATPGTPTARIYASQEPISGADHRAENQDAANARDGLEGVAEDGDQEQPQRVRAYSINYSKVRAALLWLKANNPFYRDVEVELPEELRDEVWAQQVSLNSKCTLQVHLDYRYYFILEMSLVLQHYCCRCCQRQPESSMNWINAISCIHIWQMIGLCSSKNESQLRFTGSIERQGWSWRGQTAGLSAYIAPRAWRPWPLSKYSQQAKTITTLLETTSSKMPCTSRREL